MIIHTLKWKELIWPKKEAKRVDPVLALAWGQFGPIEMEIFLAPIFGAKYT